MRNNRYAPPDSFLFPLGKPLNFVDLVYAMSELATGGILVTPIKLSL